LTSLAQEKQRKTLARFPDFPYLCTVNAENHEEKMKKELGKWFMDVAKYMVTALLLTTVFSDMNEPIIFFVAFIMSIVVLAIGLSLVTEKQKKKGNRK
jgi:hypothetical protein